MLIVLLAALLFLTGSSNIPPNYKGVWASSNSDVFIVGSPERAGFSCSASRPIIQHFDGKSWITSQRDITESLNGVWGFSRSDIFAVGGEGLILHYDGRNWYDMRSDNKSDLESVWGQSDKNIYAVGLSSRILHFDGDSWTTMEPGVEGSISFSDVWGFSSSNVYAVGNNIILHMDGKKWASVDTGLKEVIEGSAYFDGVWGSSANDIYVTGSTIGGVSNSGRKGILLHYDGTNWQRVDIGNDIPLHGISGTSVSDIFIAADEDKVVRYTGQSWLVQDVKNLVTDVWCISPDNAYFVGPGNIVIHFSQGQYETRQFWEPYK